MRDTEFLPGAAERALRPLLSGLGHFMFMAGFFAFLDLENPENDIALISGGAGVVCYILGCLLMLDAKCQPVEIWRLYRSRNAKLPPFQKTWWEMSATAGRGTVAAMLAMGVLLNGFGEMLYMWVFRGIEHFIDKDAAKEKWGRSLDHWVYKYYFAIAISAFLLSLVWAKEWPIGVRDPVSAVLLCAVQVASVYQVRAHNLTSMVN
eukprot:SAG11_NODE_4312_length_1953_cov_1.033441_2_plen_206_part_00